MRAADQLLDEIRSQAIALSGAPRDLDPLLEMIAGARFVLIGEATHGTEEFYSLRAQITKRLIVEHGFAAVAAEADWPDAYAANRYVRSTASGGTAEGALDSFERFPSWMWRNTVVRDFLEWLRDHNETIGGDTGKVGFYGLDLYSLHASMDAVVRYLEGVDPAAAARARDHYGCFDHHRAADPQRYGYETLLGVTKSCEHEVTRELVALRRRRFDYLARNGFAAGEEYFCAQQNATVVANAENYYRMMFAGRVSSWNLRDQHMTETLFSLTDHLSEVRREPAKVVVWAHNSHVGDARATEMGSRGEHNIGSLVRQAHGRDAALIGFSTHHGTVVAASRWDGPPELKRVRPALPQSYEDLLHDVGPDNFALLLRDNNVLHEHLNLSRLQRAIGVLYLPQTERQSHYFFARLPDQFDAIIHLDETRGLTPLGPAKVRSEAGVFETYPTGL